MGILYTLAFSGPPTVRCIYLLHCGSIQIPQEIWLCVLWWSSGKETTQRLHVHHNSSIPSKPTYLSFCAYIPICKCTIVKRMLLCYNYRDYNWLIEFQIPKLDSNWDFCLYQMGMEMGREWRCTKMEIENRISSLYQSPLVIGMEMGMQNGDGDR